jgi:sulfur-oxidizing protein SoxB
MGLSATASGAGLLSACDNKSAPVAAPAAPVTASAKISDDFYDLPMSGNVRILHTTDFHGQLQPVYFREPNVNLGVGDAFGRPPHLVGKNLLDAMNLKPDTPESYAYTYLDFENAAAKYGKMGGFPQMKTCSIACVNRPAADRTRLLSMAVTFGRAPEHLCGLVA